MHAQQIVDALERSACALLHDSAGAHAADSLQGFERSGIRTIQLDRKAEESASRSTNLPRARLRGLATNDRRMLLDSRRLRGVATRLRFDQGDGERQRKEHTAQCETRQGLSLLHLEAFAGVG
jgi:hypothetical protein